MSPNPEVEKRRVQALAAIKAAFGSEADEYGATMFVSHHLEEIEKEYWEKHLQTSSPTPKQVLDILVLRSHWSAEDEDGIDTFDFTLPEEVTNYVISVKFGDEGNIEEITTES